MADEGRHTVEVIVVLESNAAAPGTPGHDAVAAHAATLGVALAPLHPSTSDPELAAYAVAEVDAASAEDVIEHLMRCEGVEGAYAKPRGAPPERRTPDVR